MDVQYVIRIKRQMRTLLCFVVWHYNDVIMGAMASRITSLTIVYSSVYSDAYQRKHQSSASLAFVWGIHLWPANPQHKGPITRKMFRFNDVIMVPTAFTRILRGCTTSTGGMSRFQLNKIKTHGIFLELVIYSQQNKEQNWVYWIKYMVTTYRYVWFIAT